MLSDFLTNDELLNAKIADILAHRYKTDGGQLKFSNEDELVAYVAVEFAKMAVANQNSRQISFSGFGPIFSRIAQNVVNRIQNCRAVLLNLIIRGCRQTTTTTTTTTVAITSVDAIPRNIIFPVLSKSLVIKIVND